MSSTNTETEQVDIDLSEYGSHYSSVDIILDPGDEDDDSSKPRIYTFGCIGPGAPEVVWNNRHMSLGEVGPDTAMDSLEQWLGEHTEQLLEIAAGYEGAALNGVGQWSDAANETAYELGESLRFALSHGGIDSRWSPEDWFCNSHPAHDAADYSDLEDWAAYEVANAASGGHRLSESEVVAYLREELTEWVEDADEDSDKPAKTVAKVRELLELAN